jgi:hypothetical protein
LAVSQIAQIWIEEMAFEDGPSAPAQDIQRSRHTPIVGFPAREQDVHGKIERVQGFQWPFPGLKSRELTAEQINRQVGARAHEGRDDHRIADSFQIGGLDQSISGAGCHE